MAFGRSICDLTLHASNPDGRHASGYYCTVLFKYSQDVGLGLRHEPAFARCHAACQSEESKVLAQRVKGKAAGGNDTVIPDSVTDPLGVPLLLYSASNPTLRRRVKFGEREEVQESGGNNGLVAIQSESKSERSVASLPTVPPLCSTASLPIPTTLPPLTKVRSPYLPALTTALRAACL